MCQTFKIVKIRCILFKKRKDGEGTGGGEKRNLLSDVLISGE